MEGKGLNSENNFINEKKTETGVTELPSRVHKIKKMEAF